MSVREEIKKIVVEVILENTSPTGTPSGHIYAALMQSGISLDSYNSLMAELVREGKISGPRHHCYFPPEKERAVG